MPTARQIAKVLQRSGDASHIDLEALNHIVRLTSRGASAAQVVEILRLQVEPRDLRRVKVLVDRVLAAMTEIETTHVVSTVLTAGEVRKLATREAIEREQ